MAKQKLESLDISQYITFTDTPKKEKEDPGEEVKDVRKDSAVSGEAAKSAPSEEPPVLNSKPAADVPPPLAREVIPPEKVSREEEEKRLFEAAVQSAPVSSSTIITGKIIDIRETEVVVDICRKSDGIVPREDFVLESNFTTKKGESKRRYEEKIKLGAEIPVLIVRGTTPDGTMALSYRKARAMQAWKDIMVSRKENTPLKGRVLGMTKGGLDIDIGVLAFCPLSHLTLAKKKKPGRFFGKTYSFKVVEAERKRNNVVVSRRLYLEEEKIKKREQTLSNLNEGDIIEGEIKSLTDFGAFVDIGGIDGLVHISDITWARNLKHPSEILSTGQNVRVKVISFDREKGKIKLGIKQTEPDPWDNVEEKYPADRIVEGIVTHLTNFGAFVELEPGVEGLVHISELSWNKHINHPDEIVSEGTVIKAQVLSCDPEKKKISLGLKQITPDPWSLAVEHYKVGDKVTGTVTKINNDGIMVAIDDGVDGVVHRSDISWTEEVKSPSKYVSLKDKIDAVVLNINPVRRYISLGLKQITEDPWINYARKYHKGSVVEGEVVRITAFGAFIKLDEELDGLVHISQLSAKKVARVEDAVQLNQKVKLKVLRIDPRERKINLSIKSYLEELEREDLNSYMNKQNTGKVTLGDLVKINLDDDKEEGS